MAGSNVRGSVEEAQVVEKKARQHPTIKASARSVSLLDRSRFTRLLGSNSWTTRVVLTRPHLFVPLLNVRAKAVSAGWSEADSA